VQPAPHIGRVSIYDVLAARVAPALQIRLTLHFDLQSRFAERRSTLHIIAHQIFQ
jgi:hypothetical protein